MRIIKYAEIKKPHYTLDQTGFLFEWEKDKDHYYRLIYHDEEDLIRELFYNQTVQRIVDDKLFVWTQLCSDTVLEGYENNLLVVSRKIPYGIFGSSLSPEMMREALLAIISLSKVLMENGYELVDPHFSNIVYDGIRPLYVDLGSIKRSSDYRFRYTGVAAILKSYRLLYCRNTNFSRHKIVECFMQHGIIPEEEELLNTLIYGMYGCITNRVSKAFYYFRQVSAYRYKERKIEKSAKVTVLLKYYQNLFGCSKEKDQKKYTSYCLHKYDRLYKKVKRLKFPVNTVWGNYQDEMFAHADELKDGRFRWIVGTMRKRAVNDSLEIAGNQGFLSWVLLREGITKNAIVLDYDTVAIDKGFQRMTGDNAFEYKSGKQIYYTCDTLEHAYRCQDKYRCDLVIACALTHHLILSQGYSLDYLVEMLSSLTKRFLIVEFMPMGLWGEGNNPVVPDWYTEEWFIGGLNRRFRVLDREMTAQNRITILCEKNG